MKYCPAVALLYLCLAVSASSSEYAQNIAALIAPEKLATLAPRGANPRIQKAVAQLEAAKASGLKVEEVAASGVAIAGYRNAAAKLTTAALVRNHDIAAKLGCLGAAGLADMRRGQSPTIQRGPYKGDELSVDHIVPRSVVPELDNEIANLELMPLRLNQRKNDKIGDRQLAYALKLYEAGLLSGGGLQRVRSAARHRSRRRSRWTWIFAR